LASCSAQQTATTPSSTPAQQTATTPTSLDGKINLVASAKQVSVLILQVSEVHVFSKLSAAYKEFEKLLPPMLVQDQAVWQSGALQAVFECSPAQSHQSFAHVRVRLLAAWGEAFHKIGHRLSTYPALWAMLDTSDDTALQVGLDKFLRTFADTIRFSGSS
jgi:hypothetical protein